jgi:hypothetical protein
MHPTTQQKVNITHRANITIVERMASSNHTVQPLRLHSGIGRLLQVRKLLLTRVCVPALGRIGTFQYESTATCVFTQIALPRTTEAGAHLMHVIHTLAKSDCLDAMLSHSEKRNAVLPLRLF